MSALPRNVPTSTELRGVRWLRSSRSTGMNNCVETARPAPAAGPVCSPYATPRTRRGPPCSSPPRPGTGFVDRAPVTTDRQRPYYRLPARSAVHADSRSRLADRSRTARSICPSREVRAGGQPQPGDAVRHGRRAEAADDQPGRPAVGRPAHGRLRRRRAYGDHGGVGPHRGQARGGQPCVQLARDRAGPRRRAPARGAAAAGAARAAPAAAGARPVSKMNVRAVLTRWSITRAGPRTAPPWLPSDLERVTRGDDVGARPRARPRAARRGRRRPARRARGRRRRRSAAPCSRQASASPASGAASPSTEKTESVTASGPPPAVRVERLAYGVRVGVRRRPRSRRGTAGSRR